MTYGVCYATDNAFSYRMLLLGSCVGLCCHCGVIALPWLDLLCCVLLRGGDRVAVSVIKAVKWRRNVAC